MFSRSMYFRHATRTEIIESILQLKKECGINDVSRKFFIMCKKKTLFILYKNFFQVFYGHACFFQMLSKWLKLHPFIRKVHIAIYQTIDLSKVFENLLYNRLQNFCHASNFLAKNQFGFEKHYSTELPALSLLDKILPALDDKKYAICDFLEYSACFDTLCRSIL